MAASGVALTLNVRDSRKIRRFLDSLRGGERDSVLRFALAEIGQRTAADASENQIVRGRGLRAKPLKKQLTFRSGQLSGSISADERFLPKRIIVGATKKYAPLHEQGLRPFPKRPFLEPAARKVMDRQGPEIFRRALERARRGAERG